MFYFQDKIFNFDFIVSGIEFYIRNLHSIHKIDERTIDWIKYLRNYNL